MQLLHLQHCRREVLLTELKWRWLGLKHITVWGVAQLRLKMCQLELLPVWAFSACSVNEYKFYLLLL
jgi:hypothetical protein